MSRKLLFRVVAVVVAVWLAGSTLFTVAETEVGLLTRLGRPLPDLAGPGLHVKLPWPIDAVLRIDKRLLVLDAQPLEMLTLDKRNLILETFVMWRIGDPLRFVETLGTRFEAEARLFDLVYAELGAAIGQVPIDALINLDPGELRTPEIEARITDTIASQAASNFGLEVVAVGIDRLMLPGQNRAAVVERMKAERGTIATSLRAEGERQALEIEAEAEETRRRVLAEAEAEARRILGSADAAALKRLADAYRRDPETYAFLRSLEASEKILGEDDTVFVSAGSPALRVLGDGR